MSPAAGSARVAVRLPSASPVSNSRLRAIVDTAIDGIILMDTRGMVTMFNPACERMFGYAAAEVLGSDIKQLMPSPYRAEHDQDLDNYRRAVEPRIVGVGREVIGRRKSGDTFPLELSVGEVDDDSEVSYACVLRDLTERKHADELREKFIEQLTASNEERTLFVHVASHDLREPLRMVAAFCGRLAKDYGDRLDGRGAEYLALAIGGAAQMSRLLDDLVDFGRLGLDAARGSRFVANQVLDQVLENFAEPIRESGAMVTSDLLPQIYGNPIRFHRLMQNLIGNALKYVAEDVAPRIHVTAVREGAFWRFSVSDNGIGIDPRHHEQIFEPFKRLHAKDRFRGTGLGLAICRKIVEGFGGVMSVRSNEGQGSTFSFTVKIDGEDNDSDRTDA
jgi:two-component system sensor kinase FixL